MKIKNKRNRKKKNEKREEKTERKKMRKKKKKRLYCLSLLTVLGHLPQKSISLFPLIHIIFLLLTIYNDNI